MPCWLIVWKTWLGVGILKLILVNHNISSQFVISATVQNIQKIRVRKKEEFFLKVAFKTIYEMHTLDCIPTHFLLVWQQQWWCNQSIVHF